MPRKNNSTRFWNAKILVCKKFQEFHLEARPRASSIVSDTFSRYSHIRFTSR